MSVMDFVVNKLMEQCRHPSGFWGRLLAKGMNRGHESLTLWGLSQIGIPEEAIALDIGCGGGAAIGRLAARAPKGKIFGIDASTTSVEIAQKTNATLVREGRACIRQASVEKLPFSDNAFDVITAVETHYFWPDLPANMREVLRVLKPGGVFAIIAEVYKGSSHEQRDQIWLKGSKMAYLGEKDFERLFKDSGFSDAQIAFETEKGHICAVGVKPFRPSATLESTKPTPTP